MEKKGEWLSVAFIRERGRLQARRLHASRSSEKMDNINIDSVGCQHTSEKEKLLIVPLDGEEEEHANVYLRRIRRGTGSQKEGREEEKTRERMGFLGKTAPLKS